jgi:hypothetical protein
LKEVCAEGSNEIDNRPELSQQVPAAQKGCHLFTVAIAAYRGVARHPFQGDLDVLSFDARDEHDVMAWAIVLVVGAMVGFLSATVTRPF